jgi:hypothetical protein
VDAGADCRSKIAGTAAEVEPHLSYSLFYDAFDRSAPSRVKHSNGTMLVINENNGQAIGSLNAEQKTWSRGDKTIADEL